MSTYIFSLFILVFTGFIVAGCGGSGKKTQVLDSSKELSGNSSVSVERSKSKEVKIDAKYTRLSEAYRRRNDFLFMKEVGKLLSQNKKDLRVLNILALFHLRKNHIGLSKTIFARILKNTPNSAAVYNNLGVLSLAEKHSQKAILNFKKALKLDSSNFFANMNLASIYIQNESYEKSILLLKKAYEKEPRNLQVLNHYSLALVNIKNFSLAQRIYKEAISLGTGLENHINYAILLVDHMSDSKMGKEEIKKIKLKGPSPKQLRMLNELERNISN